MWLTSSSIGRKLVMSLTGAFLILFVTFHALMNGVAIFWPTAYNVICEFLGANWYALVGSLVLALGFILHIVYATWLTVQNRKARGTARYDVEARQPQVEWSSKNMFVLGIVVLAFLVLHLIQFWAKMQFAEITGCPVHDIDGSAVPSAAGTWFLQMAFSNGWVLAVYLIGFIALWFHMTHGFWSMFQTCGWNGKIWMPRLKAIGNAWTTIVIALFVAEAIVFTINAKNDYYTNDDKLREQYIEMYAAHDGACLNVVHKDCDNSCKGAQAICGKAACADVICANARCDKSQCNPAECNCPKGACKQGECQANNCAGCPGKVVAEDTVTVTTNE